MTYNPEAPAITTKIEVIDRVDERNPGAYSKVSLSDYLSGSISYRPNSASTLSLALANADGRYTRFFRPGMTFDVFVDLEDALFEIPIFRGFIPPGAGTTASASSGDAIVNVFAVGLLGLLAHEYVYVGDYTDGSGTAQKYTNAGNELSGAIRNELAALFTYQTDITYALQPTLPAIIISEDEEIAAGYHTRKEIVDYYMTFGVDDSIPMFPRDYSYFEGFDQDKNYELRFNKNAETDEAAADYGGTVADPVRTLDYESEILSSRSTIKYDQATRVICRSSVDSSIYETFESSSVSRRYGRFDRVLDLPTTNRDLLLRRARLYVETHRTPVFSVEVNISEPPGSYHLGQVVKLVNAQYGLSGNYTISEIGFTFSPSTFLTTLTLSSSRELLSEILSG